MVLSMSRPLFVDSYLQVTWWAFSHWKGKENASNDALYLLHLYLILPHLHVLIHELINFLPHFL